MENCGNKDRQKYGNPLPEFTTNVSMAMNALVSSTNCDFSTIAEQYYRSYMNSMGNQSQVQGSVSILGESVTTGIAYQDYFNSTSAGAQGPLKGDGWVLMRPNQTEAPPKLRERPIGCKTVFVGGIPKALADNQDKGDSVMKAIFARFAEVREIRVNRRQFAHVRFFSEEAAISAVSLSGYRIIIDGMNDKLHSSRLHVDYACNREDLREWENHIRTLERERRLQDRMNPSSPTPVTPFSDVEVSVITEKIKSTDTFEKAAAVLFTWLDRGELNRRNANNFYSLIQCANSHIRLLASEKTSCQEALESAKFMYSNKMSLIIRQLGQIQNILQAASKQKCWDHFSKPQRKNLETWRKHCEELVAREQYQHLESRQEDEMDLSDSDMEISELPSSGKPQTVEPETSASVTSLNNTITNSDTMKATIEKELNAENSRLREQVVTLQRQLIRVITARTEREQTSSNPKRRRISASPDDSEKDQEVGTDSEVMLLREVLHGAQESLLALQKELETEKKKRNTLESEIAECQQNSKVKANEELPTPEEQFSPTELQTIGLISSYLSIHPHGASLKSIADYVNTTGHNDLSKETTESLMQRANSLFFVNNEGRWRYFVFRQLNHNSSEVISSEGLAT